MANVRDVSVIGNGNVALDVARMLLKDPHELEPYGCPTSVIDELKKSNIRNLSIIGRMSAIQSAFTFKEIREISKVNHI